MSTAFAAEQHQRFVCCSSHAHVSTHQQPASCQHAEAAQDWWWQARHEVLASHQVRNGDVLVGFAFSTDDIQDACACLHILQSLHQHKSLLH